MLIHVRHHLLRTRQIDIRRDNMRTILRYSPADGRTNAACCSCDQHNVACELALWRRKLEFVLLQWPVFNGVALSVRERDKAAASLCPMHDIDGSMC